MSKKKILIVEDEIKILEVVTSLMEKQGYEVYQAEDGKQALKIFYNNEISLIILDLMLPDISGEEICMKIREKSRVPIIMLTAKVDESNLLQGLDIGADDYITKPFSLMELVARVKAHLRREKRRNSIGNNIIKIGEIEIHKDSYEVYLNKELIDLSTREFQLFLYLCENAGQVLSREQIFNSVWGSDFGDIGTVAVNIKSLRDKIDKENKYIKTIWGVGYKLIKPIGEVI